MPLLVQILLDLFLLRRDQPSAINEGSSSGMQMVALGLFGISGFALIFAILWMAHG
jgi:hypothetical protein